MKDTASAEQAVTSTERPLPPRVQETLGRCSTLLKRLPARAFAGECCRRRLNNHPPLPVEK